MDELNWNRLCTLRGKAVRVKLFSVSASGAQEYAMFHLPMGTPEKASAFAALAASCRPRA